MQRHETTRSADADRESYLRAFSEEYDHVYWTLRRCGVGAAEAEELAQEVFLVLWRRRHEIDGERRLRPWLTATAYHLATKHQVRKRRERPGLSEDLPDQAKLADEGLAAARDRLLARRAIAQLPERHRAVLVLHELEEIPVRTLAAWWDVPLFTAYTRVRAARHAFARAVVQLSSGPGTDSPSPAAIEAVLAQERRVGPAPEAAKRRARRRLSAMLLLPVDRWPELPAVEGPPLGKLPLGQAGGLFAAALSAVLLVGTLAASALTMRRPTAGDRPVAAAGWFGGVGGSTLRPLALVASLTSPRRPPPVFQPTRGGREEARRAAALGRGLTGYWSFDATAPTRDTSGKNNDCQLRRPEGGEGWSSERDGGAARFLGPGWLECPQPPVTEGAPVNLTVAVWVSPGQLWNHRGVVSRAMEGGQGELFFLGFGGDQLILRASPWKAKLAWTFPGPVGHWVHLAFTHAADGTSRLFVDGKEVGRAQGRPGRHGRVTTPLIVGAGVKPKGARGVWPSSQFKGGVDQLAVYDRALSPEEIFWLAAGTPPSIDVGPLPRR